MKSLTQENNFLYLCLSLVLLLFSGAIMQEVSSKWADTLFALITLLMFFVSIKSLYKDVPWIRMVSLLVISVVILAIIERLSHFYYSKYLNLLILFVFFLHSFITVSKQIFFQGRVTLNIIIGSLSLFFLIGLLWSVIYLFLLQLDPNALSGIEAQSWQQNFSRVTYYSFVTLTTLGYGDILPTNRLTEFFAYMEAIVGLFYMAIIVASLISTREPKSKDE